jgi:elongation factor Ts
MTVTAEAVKVLRERTGAGMMECKKALVETNGDLDAAAELMRKSGLAKADKKASRIAAEGRRGDRALRRRSPRGGRRSELRDRLRRAREDFQQFAAGVAKAALAKRPANVEGLAGGSLEGGQTIEETRRALIAKIGENISVRRFSLVEAPPWSARTCTARASARWWR